MPRRGSPMAASAKMRFVCADHWAIQAVAMLGLGHRLQCLDEVFELCGHRRKLPHHHEAAFLRRHLAEGGRRLVTREGLADISGE